MPAQHGRYPVCAATLWRWVAEGTFPAPIRLGPQTTAWDVRTLDDWDAQHASKEAQQ